MQQIINSLIHFDRSKIDIAKGIRQGFLMILPALIGYLLGFPMFGILISTGTLAHVYVFSITAIYVKNSHHMFTIIYYLHDSWHLNSISAYFIWITITDCCYNPILYV